MRVLLQVNHGKCAGTRLEVMHSDSSEKKLMQAMFKVVEGLPPLTYQSVPEQEQEMTRCLALILQGVSDVWPVHPNYDDDPESSVTLKINRNKHSTLIMNEPAWDLKYAVELQVWNKV